MSSNKSILPSLVACVEVSYYILGYNLVITHYVCVGMCNIKQTKPYFIGAANGVRLQRCSGLDTGVELERFHSNSINNKNNVYTV